MIKGSLVPNITFFKKNGELDFEKNRWHMDWMFSKGVDGLFLTGSYGAGPLMDNEERIEIFKTAKEVSSKYKGKILLPHVGCIDTVHAVELAKAAESIGVDAIGAVPPFYYQYSDEVVIGYYKEIINAVKIPVFAYNNPGTSRYTFNLKTVRTLMDVGLAGIKDSPLQVGFLSRVAYEAQQKNNGFQVIIGTSTGWLPFYFMGVRACIAGMNNWAPEIMTELIRSTFAGEMDRARDVYLVMMELSQKLHFTDSTIASHMALKARGFDCGFPRKPMFLTDFKDPKYAEIKKDMSDAFDQLDLKFETN
ncbi:MAG: dihydrodipicolinate synthase family protein [Sphaerochaetaceae bacterium]|nr:dihydrodipicolinate synthase family protein [Sphaerochaetaceae bacterium]MDD4396819.1 dihydrodipicolinate synthase family protein [Sphaerochaetaceae bacterium]